MDFKNYSTLYRDQVSDGADRTDCTLFCTIVLTLLILAACSKNQNEKDVFEFNPVDSLQLPLLSNISPKTLCVRYYEKDGHEYLFWANNPQNSIELYDISLKKHLKTIDIPEEGPQGIETIQGGFQVLNLDTIFVNGSRSIGTLFMIDTTGLVYDKIIFSHRTDGRNANNYTNLNTHIQGNVFKLDNHLYIPLRAPYFRDEKPSPETIAGIVKFVSYDMFTSQLQPSPIQLHPDIYEIPEMYFFSSLVDLNGRCYYQHANLAQMFYTDDFVEVNEVNLPSRYFTGFVPENTYATPYENIKHSFYYYSLQSDPYRQVIYRIVKLPASDPQLTDGFDEFSGKWDRGSIMVLDRNLNLLDEFLITGRGKYSWYECFVGRKGFYLKRSPNHPHYSESRITWDIYEFRRH